METKMLVNTNIAVKTSESSAVNSSILDAFDLLKALRDDEKLTGGARIILQIIGNEGNEDLKYALKRLVRSLGANIPDLRTGYFATLVTLLTTIKIVTASQLLDLVKKELHANNSSKSEVGDVALGQILVCGAIFRSGLMINGTEDERKEIINLLISASKKKSYLSTVAYHILLDFVNGLDEEQFSSIVWANIKQDFKKDIKDHTLGSLYFLLIVNKKFPNKVKLRKLIGVSELICDDTILDISEKLMAGIDFNSVSHPIYQEIGKEIANSPHLIQFWTSAIDNKLIKHNRNRELVTLKILNAILINLHENVKVLPELISKNFFKLFMDWFKGLQTASKIRNLRDDEDDHKIMIKSEKETLNILAKTMKLNNVDNNLRVEVLNKLLFDPGEINFTEITGTTLIKSIISDLEKDGVKKMAKMFKGVLLNTSKKVVRDVERHWYNNERLKAAELLSYLVIHEAVKDDTDFKLNYMKLLMCFGFFKIGGDENVAISNDLSGAIKVCFYRCFTSRFTNVDSLVSVLSSLCNFISSSLKKEQICTKLAKQFPKESMDCWKMLTDLTQNLERRDSKSKIDKVFLILLYQLGLFLFSEPSHIKVARSSIKELKSCYEHYSEGKKNNKKVKDSEFSDEPEWIEVLMEVLLSVLSIESSVLRSVVQCVFRLLCEFLTPTAIGQIVSVLDPENELNPLANESDSDNDSGSDNDGEENGDNSKNDQVDDSSESDDEDDEEMKTPDQLRIAVQKALGTTAIESDAESVDADMLDDEEANKLDEALAEAFKQFGHGKGKKNKKERKDKKNLSDFRIRVLDLINIYLEKDPSMDICLAMIAPLMRCLEFCIQDNQYKELETRVKKTIKTLTKIKKFSSTEGITIEILCDYLKATIEKGQRSHFLFQAVGDVITFFATFIVHCSLKIDVNNPKSPKKTKPIMLIVNVLKEALHNYFHNRNCLLPIIFFHSILQIEWDGNFILVDVILKNVFNNNVRQFRRNEGLDLLVGFYRALKRNKPTDQMIGQKLSEIEMTFEDLIKKNLQDETNFEIKNNFIVVLKRLINTMKTFHENVLIETSVDFQTLLDIVGSCKATKKGKRNKKTIEKIDAVILNNETKSKKRKKKRKSEQMNGHSEPQKKILRRDSIKSGEEN